VLANSQALGQNDLGNSIANSCDPADMKKAIDDEMALDIHRMYMEREDRESFTANQLWHR